MDPPSEFEQVLKELQLKWLELALACIELLVMLLVDLGL